MRRPDLPRPAVQLERELQHPVQVAGGQGADASIEAFGDTWAWGPTAENALVEVIGSGNSALIALLNAMEKFIGKNAMMAYLAMMAVRLVELHRVLKPTGSLNFHLENNEARLVKVVG